MNTPKSVITEGSRWLRSSITAMYERKKGTALTLTIPVPEESKQKLQFADMGTWMQLQSKVVLMISVFPSLCQNAGKFLERLEYLVILSQDDSSSPKADVIVVNDLLQLIDEIELINGLRQNPCLKEVPVITGGQANLTMNIH